PLPSSRHHEMGWSRFIGRRRKLASSTVRSTCAWERGLAEKKYHSSEWGHWAGSLAVEGLFVSSTLRRPGTTGVWLTKVVPSSSAYHGQSPSAASRPARAPWMATKPPPPSM